MPHAAGALDLPDPFAGPRPSIAASEDCRNGIGYGGRYIRPEALRALAACTDSLTPPAQPAASATAGLPPVVAAENGQQAGAPFPGGPVTA